MATKDPVTKGKARIGLGITRNLGNYESLRVDVELEEPYTDEPGNTRDAVATSLLDDVREKLYETLAAEIKNYRELSSSLPE